MTMTLNQFTFFAAVAKHGNVTRASEELHVSQPSISQQLRALEQAYGVKLYRRIGKGIELTEAGKVLLCSIAPILENVAQIEKTFAQPPPRAETGRLAIAGTFNPSTLLLPALAARFKKNHPEIEIELRTGTAHQLEQLLATGQVKIGVSTRRPHHPELAFERFRREKHVLFVSPTHPLARKSKVTLADVQAFPLVIRSPQVTAGTTVSLLNELAGQGLKFTIGMRCEAPYAIKEAVKKNAGIGIVFEDRVRREAEHGEFKILHGHGLKLESDSFIVYRNDSQMSPMEQEFLTLLRSARPVRQTRVTVTKPPIVSEFRHERPVETATSSR